MPESDTMFNERDQRCAAVQPMLSTDPSYDNRTIASTLKMQIRTVQRAQGDENKVSGYGYGLWCGFKWGPHHVTSHQVDTKVNTKVYLDVLKSVMIPWRNQVAGGRPRFGFRRSATTLHPSLTGSPPPPTWTRWTTSFGHTSRTSPTWPPTSACGKACSHFRIRIEAVIEAEGGYIE